VNHSSPTEEAHVKTLSGKCKPCREEKENYLIPKSEKLPYKTERPKGPVKYEKEKLSYCAKKKKVCARWPYGHCMGKEKRWDTSQKRQTLSGK